MFWYPLIMSIVWMVGGILFYFRIERNATRDPVFLIEEPLVSILIPCYNEEETIEETIQNLQLLKYPHFEIIAINDGSKDNTSAVLKRLSRKTSNLRVIDLKENAGKANALYLGFIASKGEILMGLDADAYLDPYALHYMIPHFTTPKNGERVGAVTGNPRVRNRSSLIAKIQLCEFSSIIGLIKRSQRILGKVMTVSGVVVAFRKRALMDCGLWDRDLITEDIGVTWKLQKKFWDVRYEPRAICWMLVPETIKGIWKQRVRWAQGGIEVILRHRDVLFHWKYRRLVPIYLEQVCSIVWSISWIIVFIIAMWHKTMGYSDYQPIQWEGAYISIFCILQFIIAMRIDQTYDEKLSRYYLWVIWYPIFYWYINAFAILRALPKAIFRKRNTFAVWESPDRGISA
ncbi:poly-beta-1,6-N-acetyl-D-glucosamine synthase [Ammoniphilus sp. 3BR4]|uniref:poly-beta-1,6-N-acetyl-D-glucosamine synthase n=1 Tax=Ammoniphilus sp. 3BR4 TaxID=3158265 RepID=UPI003467DE7A